MANEFDVVIRGGRAHKTHDTAARVYRVSV